MLTQDPQNPYQSFMVEASAGTGKTYQLTRRFLLLVGAGADPSEILAITFTVKAVGEMHERIISEASTLLVNEMAQRDFEKRLGLFYKQFLQGKPEDYQFARPRSARETAELILASTQRLKITTIDSIFYEWVTRFPAESAGEVPEKESFLRSLNLVESYENEKLSERAWDLVLQDRDSCELFEKQFSKIDKALPQKGFLGIRKQVEELYRYRLHIFYLEQKGFKPFLSYTVNLGEDFLNKSLSELIGEVKEELLELSRHTKKEERLAHLVSERNFSGLVGERLLTQKGLVSKSLLRGAKREGLSLPIARVEEVFSSFFHERSKHNLNVVGESLFEIYRLWSSKREELKKNLMVCEFSDLSMACHNLFSKDSHSSILWLLQKSIHHLLIDEFQDTSMVQWEVFSHLLEDVLSSFESVSDDKSHKTSFVVGDRKQSIYGFREADPYVMNLSAGFFDRYEKGIVSLNASYRTSPLIMDFLSDFFLKKIDRDFPRHVTARKECESPVIPDVSRVVVYENFSKEGEGDLSPLEREARNLASFFEEIFTEKKAWPIYDKTKKVFRALQPRDCVVLYRNATHVDTFLEAFEEKNIPAKKEGEANFFEFEEVKAVISFLKFLVNKEDLLSLVSFLNSSFFELEEAVLLRALENSREKEDRLEVFSDLLLEEDISLESFKKLKEEVPGLLPHKIILLLYKNIPSSRIFDSQEEKKTRVSLEKNLMTLVDVFLDLEKKGYLTLISCLEELEKISEIGLQLAQESSHEAVSFMSIHKSKGLEFPLVALIEASDSWFKFDRYWIKSASGLHYCGTYDAMPHEDRDFKTVYKNSEKLMFEESIRLLYVALTRASQYLCVSAHSSSSATASRFHGELLSYMESHGALLEKEKSRFVLESGLNPPPTLELLAEKTSKKEREEDFFSFTPTRDISIVTPHDVPRGELASEEEKKPQSSKNKRVASMLGSFLHKVFELKLKGKDFSYEKLWESFLKKSSVVRASKVSEEEKRKLFEEVKEECERNFNSSQFQTLLKDAVEIEPEYSVLSLQGSFMTKGVIDLFIRYKSGDILIVDFKTSEVKEGEDLRAFCELRGYDRQLWHYEKAVRAIYREASVKKVVWFTKVCKFTLL